MHDIFRNIRAVGFDMDGTLYTYIPEISERIIDRASEVVLDLKPELGTLGAARDFFINTSKEKESRYKAMDAAGHENPKFAMRKILEEANTDELITYDERVSDLIRRMSESKYTYLITTSPSTVGSKVLKKIGIDESWFKRIVYGDDKLINGQPKVNAMKDIIKESGIPAEEHVYIGDREISDIIEPKSIGMRTIAVGNEIPEADISVQSVYDIEGLLL